MNKDQLKKILKPMIKECIKEVIFEDGTLSTIISEVVKGTGSQKVVYESKQVTNQTNQEALQRKQKQLLEQKRKMLDAIGKDAYNSVDPHGSKALDGVAPNDPGVDISSFAASGIWKKLAGN